MKSLYLESIAGIAGDMFSASFIDSGLVKPEELAALPRQLGLSGVEVVISQTTRATMRATHIDVRSDKSKFSELFEHSHIHSHSHASHDHDHAHEHNHWHAHYRDLRNFIEAASGLAPSAKAIALTILDHLGEAEAHCHGMKKEDVEFHEVGTIDSLMDIIMAAFCISKVTPDKVYASPVKLGRGIIKIQHGTHPVPPPGSAYLALGMPTASVPAAIQRENIELSTPTGLAILKTLKPIFVSEWPSGYVLAQGNGAGTMDLGDYPNLFRVCLIDESQKPKGLTQLPFLQDSVMEIVANFDDVSSERLAWLSEKLYCLGAIDVWQTPATGKKGRILIILSALVPVEASSRCAEFLLKKSSTFGLRYRVWDRLKLDRKFESRISSAGTHQVKVGLDTEGSRIKEKLEFEDLRKTWDLEFDLEEKRTT